MNLLRSTVKFCMFAKPVVTVDNENPTIANIHSDKNEPPKKCKRTTTKGHVGGEDFG